MLVGLCGAVCSGKSKIADFLARELGFTVVKSPAALRGSSNGKLPVLYSQCWRRDINVVIEDVAPGDKDVAELLKRPYFLLVYVSAPLMTRYNRMVVNWDESYDLAAFVEADDELMHGSELHRRTCLYWDNLPSQSRELPTLPDLATRSQLHIFNSFETLEDLYGSLRDLDITNPERLRPGWDRYFMSLAELASERTNCMKRRVGCVIARNKRVVATGYNGTPSKVRNCHEGGCPRCNGAASKQGAGLDLCLCLHAEENAIIEAGRERCEGATLYTNLFPCTLCAKKIIQAGISRVVYLTEYATDVVAKKLLQAGQIIVECLGE